MLDPPPAPGWILLRLLILLIDWTVLAELVVLVGTELDDELWSLNEQTPLGWKTEGVEVSECSILEDIMPCRDWVAGESDCNG